MNVLTLCLLCIQVKGHCTFFGHVHRFVNTGLLEFIFTFFWQEKEVNIIAFGSVALSLTSA